MLKLQPFASEADLAGLNLQSTLLWSEGVLRLQFRLQAPDGLLQLANPASHRQRRDGLWQTTCFEAFIGVAGQAQYWEINLASSEDWNVYRLEAYRQGLVEEEQIKTIAIQQHRQCREGLLELELSAQIAMGDILDDACQLEGSLTAVLETSGGGLSYWALKHSGPEPDFHRRDSFCWRS